MKIKNKFILFFSIIILAFVSALVFLLSRTESMIIKSLYNDFTQIANSTAKEVDRFLLERILSLETLSHNEGMKMEISGTDDTGKTIAARRRTIQVLDNTGATDSATVPLSIKENKLLQEVLEDFIKINTDFHSVEIISASGQTIAYMLEDEGKLPEVREAEMLKKIGRDRSKKQLFIDTKAGNDRYYLQDVVREDDGAFTIDIAVPILLEREGKKIFIGAIL